MKPEKSDQKLIAFRLIEGNENALNALIGNFHFIFSFNEYKTLLMQ